MIVRGGRESTVGDVALALPLFAAPLRLTCYTRPLKLVASGGPGVTIVPLLSLSQLGELWHCD